MEQSLFDRLAAERTIFEWVRCAEPRILAAWDEALADARALLRSGDDGEAA